LRPENAQAAKTFDDLQEEFNEPQLHGPGKIGWQEGDDTDEDSPYLYSV
jgi:hypothetical protein